MPGAVRLLVIGSYLDGFICTDIDSNMEGKMLLTQCRECVSLEVIGLFVLNIFTIVKKHTYRTFVYLLTTG